MRIRAIFATAAIGVLAAGCYLETADERAPDAGSNGTALRDDVGQCQFKFGRGCFDGHVTARTAYFVDGKQYFNADDMAAHFADLVRINDADGNSLTAGREFSLALVSQVTNGSFESGFEYFLTGGQDGSGGIAKSGKVTTNGDFSINDLPEGVYDLRVERAVKFNVVMTPVASAPVAQPSASPSPADGEHPDTGANATAGTDAPVKAPAPDVRPYCATLYTDVSIEIRRGKRVWNSFNDYKLHVTDRECEASPSGATVTIDRG
jgi:hypothetical protein